MIYWKQKIAALLEPIVEVRVEIMNCRHREADGWEKVKKNPARLRATQGSACKSILIYPSRTQLIQIDIHRGPPVFRFKW